MNVFVEFTLLVNVKVWQLVCQKAVNAFVDISWSEVLAGPSSYLVERVHVCPRALDVAVVVA